MLTSTTASPHGRSRPTGWPVGLSARPGHDAPNQRRDPAREVESLFPDCGPASLDPTDALDSLAPTHRVAPERTAAPLRARRWRPRPAMTETISGLAAFVTLVLAVTTPAAAYAGRGLVLGMLLAVVIPPVTGWLLFQASVALRMASRGGVLELARLLCGLGACFAVGLSIGGMGFVVQTAPTDALAILEPVLVAATYSVMTAVSAGLLAWSLRRPAAF